MEFHLQICRLRLYRPGNKQQTPVQALTSLSAQPKLLHSVTLSPNKVPVLIPTHQKHIFTTNCPHPLIVILSRRVKQ